MRMPGAFPFSTFVELPQAALQPILLSGKIARVADHQCLIGWIVFGKRLLVRVNRLYQRPKDPAHEYARRIQLPRRHVQSRRAMRYHLRHVHFAPVALRRRLQAVNTRHYIVDRFFLK
jgi:hypothetical protein